MTLNFNSNGGSEVQSITLNTTTFSVLPDNPTKEGFTFDGWFTDEGLTNELHVNELDINASSITVYAKWIQDTFLVSFETNSDDEIETLTVQAGSIIPLPTVVLKDGYYFYGWYTDETLTSESHTLIMPNHDLILYARWTDSMFYYTINENNEATITGIIPELVVDEVVVPDTVDNYPVISISYDAFDGYTNIKSLTLPDSLVSLPIGVLHDQVNLSNLTTPFIDTHRLSSDPQSENYTEYSLLGKMFFIPTESLPIIDDGKLYQSYVPYSLRYINITDSTVIGKYSFAYTNLWEVTLNEGVTQILYGAYTESNGMVYINIPASVSYIEPGAFFNMEHLYYFFVDSQNEHYITNELNDTLFNIDQTELLSFANGETNYYAEIPNTVTIINDYAFAYSNIFTIIIPNSVTLIGDYAFANCKSLETITFEENSQLESIRSYAFSQANLNSITIPNSVLTIYDFAFYKNLNLQSVQFEANSTVRSIGITAFGYTLSLREIIIPISVTGMYHGVFYGDHDITIYVEAESKPVGWSSSWLSLILEDNVVWGYTN